MPGETIIAIDPALRKTGFAILRRDHRKVSCLESGVHANKPSLSSSGCLLAIHDRIADLIGKWHPEAMAVEGVIFVQSYQTAITLGAARGVAILAGARHGLAIHEYAPRKVKQAVVGRGAADKQQVAFMVRALLGLTRNPTPDEADAIAVGLAHFQAIDSAALRKPTAI